MKRILTNLSSQTSLARVCCAVLAGLGAVLPALGAAPSRTNPLDCVLEPYEVVEVSSAVHGVINQIHVSRNDMVGKGQLLVELDSEVERTQVELARARATLKTDIELRETELAFHERNEERLEHLYKSDTVSLHLKDEAETDTEKSRLQLRSARDNKRLAELELAEAEAMLALRSMHSPISGVVVARNKVAGEYVEDQSILRLAQLDPLKVEVIAPVELFGSITEGMRVEVVPEHLGQEPVYASVTMVDRVIDPASGTFDVRAELPNPDLAIPSGLRCTVQFLTTPYPSAAIAEVAETETGPESGLEAAPEPVAAAPAEKTRDLFADTAAPTQSPAALEAQATLCPAAGPAAAARYYVFVDPESHSLSAAQLLEQMRTEGVHDLFVVARGGNRGKVSVGLYSRRDNAEKRVGEISGLGFLAYLEPQTQKVPAPACNREDQVAAHDI